MKTYYELATILIAVSNTIILIIFWLKDKSKGDEQFSQDTNRDLMKSVILEHKMSCFYNIISDLFTATEPLCFNCSDENKLLVAENVDIKFIELRQKFISVFYSLNSTLYKRILDNADECQKKIIDAIFDEGINLNHKPTFHSKMIVPISDLQSSVVGNCLSPNN